MLLRLSSWTVFEHKNTVKQWADHSKTWFPSMMSSWGAVHKCSLKTKKSYDWLCLLNARCGSFPLSTARMEYFASADERPCIKYFSFCLLPSLPYIRSACLWLYQRLQPVVWKLYSAWLRHAHCCGITCNIKAPLAQFPPDAQTFAHGACAHIFTCCENWHVSRETVAPQIIEWGGYLCARSRDILPYSKNILRSAPI